MKIIEKIFNKFYIIIFGGVIGYVFPEYFIKKNYRIKIVSSIIFSGYGLYRSFN